MTTAPILVLGGTGKTGRRVTRRLERGGLPFRVVSRSSSLAFDWFDESTWPAASQGVDIAYLAAPLGIDGLGAAAEWVRRQQGGQLRRLVLLSGRDAESADRTEPIYVAERALENAVRASGVGWTVLRSSWFAQNFSEGFLGPAILHGEVRLAAGSGREPFVDLEDLADVALAALTDERHAGRTYSLSGPQALSFRDAAAVVAAATGRTVRYVDLRPEDHLAELLGLGLPPVDAQAVLDLLAVVRNGSPGAVSDDVERVLGRQPRDLADWARHAAGAGIWSS
ncbi:MAG: NAD(P)H-binding protein [Dermatophilaceae bacterium]